jgi:hypothetical protein
LKKNFFQTFFATNDSTLKIIFNLNAEETKFEQIFKKL